MANLLKYGILIILPALCCILPGTPALAQKSPSPPAAEPKVVLEADRQEIKVGEQVEITMSVSYPTDYKIIAGNKYPQVDGLNRLGIDKVGVFVSGSERKEETTRTFQAESEGEFIIAPIKLSFRTPEGKTVDAQSNGLAIIVLKEGAPQEGLRDIKGLKPIKTPPNLLIHITIAAIAVALILLVLIFMGRKPRPAVVDAPARLRNIEDEFIAKLNQLPVPDEYDAEGVKKIYFSMSEIVRTYLATKWKLEAREETTGEVLVEMGKTGFSKRILEGYEILGRAFDMVKYAKGRPFKDDIEAARQAAIDFIRLMAALGDLRETVNQ